MTDKKEHWNQIYLNKTFQERSWYQEKPETSIRIIEQLNLPLDARIIDIGGGESYLVDYLLARGYTNITVLDISDIAISKAKARLGNDAQKVQWIVSDINDFQPKEKYDFWHDRATFHFLKEAQEIKNYVAITRENIATKGVLVVGTFSENGPIKCSGIKISQYSTESLENLFAKDFRKKVCDYLDHKTPNDHIQNFVFCVFEKT